MLLPSAQHWHSEEVGPIYWRLLFWELRGTEIKPTPTPIPTPTPTPAENTELLEVNESQE